MEKMSFKEFSFGCHHNKSSQRSSFGGDARATRVFNRLGLFWHLGRGPFKELSYEVWSSL